MGLYGYKKEAVCAISSSRGLNEAFQAKLQFDRGTILSVYKWLRAK